MISSFSRHRLLMVSYTATILLSALLLFLVQPMFARMVLPLLGGTPAVWNTCMVFFQATLLLGYLYAHVTTKWLSPKYQAVVHLCVMFLPILLLPIAVPANWQPPSGGNPVLWLLALLSVSVGLPFFVIATTNPLLQTWFSATGHPACKDPYFLYAASNVGSLLALVSYPLLLEPALRLATQGWLWSAGYGLLVLAMLGSAILLWRSPAVVASESVADEASARVAERPAWRRRLKWVLWAFIPSSLMLGVTTHVSTDVASFPLLWIIPLTLYLLTFILVFARREIVPQSMVIRLLPWLAIPLAISMNATASREAVWLLIGLNLMTFFVASMVCHGQLAKDRPHTKYLTEFYLWMSFGGVLGGIFNAMVAPLLFDRIYEYSFALVLACLVIPCKAASRQERTARVLDFVLPSLLVAVIAGLACVLDLGNSGWGRVVLLGIPAMVSFTFAERPVRFGLGVAAILLSGMLFNLFQGEELYAERSFFGVNRVATDSEQEVRKIFHGTTAHGWQALDAARDHEPMAYYHRGGPIGALFQQYDVDEAKRIAVVGLGCGGLAAYHEPDRHFTFYEIDPVVKRIAENRSFFRFLSALPVADYEVVLGDGRLTMQEAPEHGYDLIFMDAFSSDAIPVHLVTREAVQIYLSKLSAEGVLVFNITNRFVDLEQVVAALAEDADLVCLSCPGTDISQVESKNGGAACHFMMLARDLDHLRDLPSDPRWKLLGKPTGVEPWTDDFSNVVKVLKW
ncbi:MAG TPA: hypothetical protein DCY79_23050 [Planctomycetaceae bacterium]|nr:hypothetical protein [Planctomycetaceae bacterium]